MIQSTLTVSESEAAERLEELVALAANGVRVIIKATDGQLIWLQPCEQP